jgi:5-methylcytosine-specific restriction protein B
MPYFTEEHVSHALKVLPGQTHPSLVSFLAMLRNKVPIASIPTEAFGSAQETELLKDYFCPLGGPSDRPWYVPFGKAVAGQTPWRPKHHAGTSLQRMRKDKQFLYKQGIGTSNDLWSLDPAIIKILNDRHAEVIGEIPISVHNLATWCYRDLEFLTQQEAIAKFIEEFDLIRYGLLGAIFDASPDPALTKISLGPSPMGAGVIKLLVTPLIAAPTPGGGHSGSAVTPGPEDDPTWDVDPAEVHAAISGLHGVDEPAFRAMAALRAGMHVIFTGPPGTGKTQLAQKLCQASKIPRSVADRGSGKRCATLSEE